LALFGELADDPKAKKFAAKHLSGKGLRLLDKIARLGLNSTGLSVISRLVSRFRSSYHFAEPRFQPLRRDIGKPIDLVWLWFRSPRPKGNNDAEF